MNEIKITAYKCKKCGYIHYPKHERCLKCKGREFEEFKPEGNVKLLAYTQQFNLPWGFDERFLIIGIAQFENGVKAMGQIKAESLGGIKSGMTMKPSWEPVRYVYGEPVYGLKFEPR
ncbi:MAG: zinc ribbon domain-containing protein, partial [Chloroflexota bacterium]|nr:zinc ribbon domain-containing protein [Chloroflexota bacterium]